MDTHKCKLHYNTFQYKTIQYNAICYRTVLSYILYYNMLWDNYVKIMGM